jgi:predicted NBD/HSP70 family sugar kinase
MRAAPSSWPLAGALQAVALEILRYGPLPRTDVARRLDLSPGTLTRLAGELIAAGLIADGAEQPTGNPGRGTRPLRIIPDSHHFIGMKLTGTTLFGLRTNLRSDAAAFASVPLRSTQPEEVADQISEFAEKLAADVAISGIGIGLGGRIDNSGLVVSAPFLRWQNVPLATSVSQRLNVPVVIDNDLTALTEFENWFGDGAGLDRFAVVTIGAGVGYGAVANREVITSVDAGLGLVGHWPLDPLGPLCPEGHRGCAHAMLAMPSIAAAATQTMGRDVDYQKALELASSGTPGPRRVVNASGHALGLLIADIANLILPQLVIIGGEGALLAEVAAESLQSGISERRHPKATPLNIVISKADDELWCRGAAVRAIERFVLGTTATGGEVPA